ncbi:ubiquinone anaerobic biosynthesis accessory factor UbiT [Zooshikella harenae]|uniref:SCP2 sterol-binding domain-containing protein n=1 Tax=Zooshikella harenae TaxID=2827238 RepID=A0ABS5ZFQ8_9GAMM|nr:SCP2 sterol-binding domain-containing protein [Zooshikella harenae]MBU2712844.1 SCP2 sterol-binding domain-containing protein [Zooshikella harenae]
MNLLFTALEKHAALLTKPVQLCPTALQTHVLEKLLNHLLHSVVNEGELDFLEDQWIELKLLDCDLNYFLSYNPHAQRCIVQDKGKADASISCKLTDAIALITQQVDPDTLFFQRRLLLEGNTALSHGFKNILDTIELDKLGFPLGHIIQLLSTTFPQPQA